MTKGARVGVVDVGSNSVRLVVFDGMARSPAYFFNEKVLCGLGAGLASSGKLNPQGKVRALAALRRFAALTKDMGTGPLHGIATAAVREARDGPAFVEQVLRETGIQLQVATGVEEAAFSAKGVLLGWPDASGMVCDIGGASMEIACLEAGEIGQCETSPLGPLKLQDFDGEEAALDTYIDTEVAKLLAVVGTKAERLFLVGGSWRALARLDMARQGYPFLVLHEYVLTPEALRDTAAWVQAQDQTELAEHTETSAERLALVPMASKVMAALIDALNPTQITISSYGLREGVFYDQMPINLRALDPLIEACGQMEQAMARFPGFGKTLFDWLQPLFPDLDQEQHRLMHAACLLHDTSWQAHPDYRAEMCFESITRANLGGVNHEGRVFLGLSILSRYKNAGYASLELPVRKLLSSEQVALAVTYGKAMRLGAMISGAQGRLLAGTKLSRSGDDLVLELASIAEQLSGEVVEKRLAALAKQMNLTPVLTHKT